MSDLSLRADLKAIAGLIEPESTVLDVGCGDGDLLYWLQVNKNVAGRGIEIDGSRVNTAISRGLSVIQGDADEDLQFYPKKAYDYVVLSQTLQRLKAPKETLELLVGIAEHAIVSVPNFGYWKNRLYLALHGKMPVTETLNFTWYDTPNIHFCTISDFIELCEVVNVQIEQRLYVSQQGIPSLFSRQGPLGNFFGEQGIFMIKR